MDWDDLLPWFAMAALGAFGLALKTSFDTRSLRVGLGTLTNRVRFLDGQLRQLDERFQGLQPPSPAAETAAPAAPAEEPLAAPAAPPEPVIAQPEHPVPTP